MPRLRGLTILVAGADAGRLHAALSVAAAWAALGREARLFLQAEAVALLGQPEAASDARYRAAGLPTLLQMIEESLALGVSITACQSGLALADLSADALPAGVETGGLLDMLSRAGDDQLLFA